MNESKVTLADLDFNAACEQAHEFEVVSPKTGKPMGVFISVLGDGAQKVQDFTAKEQNKRRSSAGRTVEEDTDSLIESAVTRTVGWRDIVEPFSLENARKLYRSNPMVRNQVLVASGTAGNFSKA